MDGFTGFSHNMFSILVYHCEMKNVSSRMVIRLTLNINCISCMTTVFCVHIMDKVLFCSDVQNIVHKWIHETNTQRSVPTLGQSPPHGSKIYFNQLIGMMDQNSLFQARTVFEPHLSSYYMYIPHMSFRQKGTKELHTEQAQKTTTTTSKNHLIEQGST